MIAALPIKTALHIGEWIQEALDCAEETPTHRRGDADNIFISYLLSRLDAVGVPGAIRIRERLSTIRIDAILAAAGLKDEQS